MGLSGTNTQRLNFFFPLLNTAYMSIIRQWIYRGGHYSYRGKSLVHMYVCVCRFLYMLCMCMWEREREQERVRAGWTAALIWFCLLSTQSRNVSRGNTWRVGKMGEEVVVVSALPLALYQAYMDAQTHTHTHLTCVRAAWDPNQQHLTKLSSFCL